MSDRIDHVARAERLIEAARGRTVSRDAGAVVESLLAQAEATLALVEQQRIANLVALADTLREVPANQIVVDARGVLFVYREHEMGGWVELHPDIAAALGIERNDQ